MSPNSSIPQAARFDSYALTSDNVNEGLHGYGSWCRTMVSGCFQSRLHFSTIRKVKKGGKGVIWSLAALVRILMPRVLHSRQRIPLGPLVAGSFFALVDGLGVVEGFLDKDQLQVVSLVFAGDVMFPKTLPPLSKPSLRCMSEQNLVKQRSIETAFAPDKAKMVSDEMAYTAARMALQSIVIAHLTGEERVATLLYEFALRRGSVGSDGCAFEMPISRADSALYLGLNPDSVSRYISALKSDAIVFFDDRVNYQCPDLDRLASRSPVSGVLKSMIAQKQEIIGLIS